MSIPSSMMICQTTPCFVLVTTALMEFAPFSHTGDAHCKTSWGLPIAGGNDSLNYFENDNPVILSEHQLLENPGSYGNQAYNGGLLDYTFKYAKDLGGLNSECAYLYILNHWSCQNSAVLIGMLIALLGTLLATHATQVFSELRRVYPCEQNHLRGTEPGTQTCERLCDEKSRHKRWTRWLSPAVVALVLAGVSSSTKADNLRKAIKNGNAPCFQHIPEKKLFILNCSVLNWLDQGYSNSHAIELRSNEVFDGSCGIINLSGVEGFTGLFCVNQVNSFTEAPIVQNVHVKNGTTGKDGGFIVQKAQAFFSVDSCSSSGDIVGEDSGGIYGKRAGQSNDQSNAQIQISNSYSTGRISGRGSGGITGNQLGYDGGVVNVTRCYSTGNIIGRFAGGICGEKAGDDGGTVYVTETYSRGDILEGEDGAGGIMGAAPGSGGGKTYIHRCYSTGQISAENSGGITGAYASQFSGEVHIVDCYSRGNVSGSGAGGITGAATGGEAVAPGDYGNVNIIRVYASGSLHLPSTGGIIGTIYDGPPFTGSILVEHSVYNGQRIIGMDIRGITFGDAGTITFEANSGNIGEIRGELYERNGTQYWDDGTWTVHDADELPILLFQLGETSGDTTMTETTSAPTPSSPSTPSVTPSSSSSPSVSPTSSMTSTPTRSQTPTKTSTGTSTASSTSTPSRTQTPTSTITPSSSSTPTNSRTVSPSPSVTGSFTPTPPVTSSSSDSSTISSGTAAALATSIIVVFLLGVALVIFWRYRTSRSTKTNSTDNPDQTSSTVNDESSTSGAGEGEFANKSTQNTRSKVEVSEV